MNRRIAILVSSLIAALQSIAVLAYQTVKVAPGGAVIFANPEVDSPTVDTLDAGVQVNIGDNTTHGYYRCSGPGGLTGWIQVTSIVFPPKGSVKPIEALGLSLPPSDATVYLSVLGGVAALGGGSAITTGVEVGYRFQPEWGVGFYGTYVNPDATTLSVAAIETNYYLLGSLSGMYLTAKAGFGLMSITSAADATLNLSSAGGVVGFGVGYDLPLVGGLSLGGEVNYLLVFAGGGTGLLDGLAKIRFEF